MNNQDFWSISTAAQISTALVLIAVSLVYIAFKLSKGKKPSRFPKR